MKNLSLTTRTAVYTTVDAETITNFQLDCAKQSENRDLERPAVLEAVQRILSHHSSILPGIGQYLLVENEVSRGTRVPIACCLLQHQVSEWTGNFYLNVESVYVHEDYRGLGILQYMLAKVEADARDSGYVSEIRLSVAETNKPMHWALEKADVKKSKYVIFSKQL